jgi:uncharacterized protein YkwD
MHPARLLPILLCLACTEKDEDPAPATPDCGSDEFEIDGECVAEDQDTGADTGADTGGDEPPVPISVEEACGTDDYGYDTPSDDASSGLERTNCYRNLMGLDPTILEPHLDAAAQAHADFMHLHDTLGHTESEELEGYTGDHVWDRMDAAGYPRDSGQLWSEVVSRGFTPAEAIDNWMNTVYHREALTLATWYGCGFGQAGEYSSMAQVMAYPDLVRRAVVYPVDGQIDVPTTFNSNSETPDPAPDHWYVGSPVTVTVVDTDVSGSDHNIYQLQLEAAQLLGPDDTEVEVLVLSPVDDSDLGSMVALVPVTPLVPDTTYRAELTVTWTGQTETVTTEFTTASE